MQILVAEDDPVTRRLLRKTLESWGHDVTAVADGASAWVRWQQGGIRLLIADWMMPGMDGPELCHRIRAANTGSLQPVYLIILTARDTVQDLATAFKAGADDFIRKPFDNDELRARLQAGERILALTQELIRAREEMERLALTDALTGLPNRRAILDLLRKEEDRMRRDNRPVAIVMGDIDHFKAVNDRYGHKDGDRVLRLVADGLAASVRGADTVARWGGEEFLLLLPGADVIQAAEVAERCRTLIASQRLTGPDGQTFQVTISLGAAATEGTNRCDVMALVQQADKALYWAKNAGRNRVKIYIASAEEAPAPPT